MRAAPSRRRAPGSAWTSSEAAADDRCDEQDADAGEQPAQAPVRASGFLRFLLGELTALGDERALDLVELEGVVGAPVEGCGESRSAVELTRIAIRCIPFGRRLRDVAPKPAPVGVLVDPVA